MTLPPGHTFPMKQIHLGDNLKVLRSLPRSFARLIYIDPPFNTGKPQKRERMRVLSTAEKGDRGGFGGNRFHVEKVASDSYGDSFDDFEGLRAAMIAEVPALGQEGLADYGASLRQGKAGASGTIGYPIKDFYLTNPVARASETMQRCSAELLHGQDFAEAAE